MVKSSNYKITVSDKFNRSRTSDFFLEIVNPISRVENVWATGSAVNTRYTSSLDLPNIHGSSSRCKISPPLPAGLNVIALNMLHDYAVKASCKIVGTPLVTTPETTHLLSIEALRTGFGPQYMEVVISILSGE